MRAQFLLLEAPTFLTRRTEQGREEDHGVSTARDLDTQRRLAGNCMTNQLTGKPKSPPEICGLVAAREEKSALETTLFSKEQLEFLQKIFKRSSTTPQSSSVNPI